MESGGGNDVDEPLLAAYGYKSSDDAMTKKRKPTVADAFLRGLNFIKSYWVMLAFAVSSIAFLATLPGRLQKVEAAQEETNQQVQALLGWSRELQGYTRAQQEFNQQWQQQQHPQEAAPQPDLPEASTDRTCFDERTWQSVPCRN